MSEVIIARKEKVREGLLFIVGGALNTGLTYGMFLVLEYFIHYQLAYALAYFTGIVFSYLFNTIFVFKVALKWSSFCTYPVVYVIQYVFSAILLSVLIEYIEISSKIGPLIVTIVLIPFTFVLSRFILRNSSGN